MENPILDKIQQEINDKVEKVIDENALGYEPVDVDSTLLELQGELCESCLNKMNRIVCNRCKHFGNIKDFYDKIPVVKKK